MLRHVALFRFRPDVPEGFVDEVSAALATLPGLIPELLAYTFGPDAGLVDGNYEFGVVADVADEAGFTAYQQHPEHQRILRELFRPNMTDRAAIQLRI